MNGLSITTWAALTAASVAVATLPRPRSRRPCPAPVGEPPPAPTAPRRRRRVRRFGGRRQPGAEATALAQWCEGVARSVRSGASLGVAVGETTLPDDHTCRTETVETLRAVAAAVRHGHRPPPAPPGDLALVIAVLTACIDHGGPAAEPLDRAAAVLRGRAHEAAERATQSAQARLSAQVMTLLPMAMLLMLVTTSASVRAVVMTPPALVTIAAGSALNAIGWRWQRRLLRGAAA